MKNKLVLILLSLTLILAACTYSPKQIPCDAFELVDAINKANQAGGIHTLELAQGCTYELTWIEDMTNGNNGLPTISTDITINGHGATIIRANDAPNFRIFHIDTAGLLTLNNLTIQNGYADGAGLTSYEDYAGAILNFGTLAVDSVLITENYAGYVGGIISMGSADITRSTISHNNADHLTNAIINANAGVMVISHSTISENGINTYGDAIWNNGTLEIINSTISDNNGVGIENDEDSTGPGLVSLEYVTFSGNAAALNSVSGKITIRNTLIGPQQAVACGSGTYVTALGVNMDTDGTCNITTVTPNSLKLGPLADNGGSTKTNALGSGSVAINAAIGDCPVNDQRGIHRPVGSACDVGAFENDGQVVKQAPPLEACKFTAIVKLFCRLGPGRSQYPEIDRFTPGEESEVLGISPDGNFVQVIGAANELPCYVPIEEQFGELKGNCDDLAVLEPPATAIPDEPKDKPEKDKPVEGCKVLQDDESFKCVSPCPAGIGPGDPCTMP